MLRTVFGMSLGAALMALALWLGRPLLKKYLRPSLCYGLWLLVLLRLCVPLPGFLKLPVAEPVQTVYVTPAPIPVPTSAPAVNQTYAPPPTPMPQPTVETVLVTPAPAPVREQPRLYVSLPDLEDVALWLWLLGAAALIAFHIVGYIRFAAAIRKTRREAEDWELALLRSLDSSGRVSLCRCNAVPVPLLMGFLRPAIVLGDEKLTENELRSVLLHELTHYRRGDLAVKWFATLLLSLHWFNPLCPLIRRELDHACELSCDEAVVAELTPHERQGYGETLIRLSAEHGLPRGLPTTTLSEGKEQLKERLFGIMNYRKRDPLTILLGLVCALLLIGCGAAVGGAEPTEAPAPTPMPVLATDGNIWATDGNIWATSGDAFIAPYATMGNAQLAGEMDWYAEFTTPGNARGGEELTVSTVDEFLDALAPGVTVVLEPGVYDLGSVQPMARQYAYWLPTWDGGMELVLTGLNNTRIVSATGDSADVSIVSPHATSAVIRMEHCYSSHFEGITMGHSVEPGVCTGSVLHLENSYAIYLDGMDLYGCGTVGIETNNAGGITVVNSRIHDCSYSGVVLNQANTVLFKDTDFINCGEFSLINIWSGSWVKFEDCRFAENEMSTFLTVDSGSGIVLQSCEVKDNYFSEGLVNSFYSGVEFFDTYIDESQYNSFYQPWSTVTPIYMDGEEIRP